MRNIIYWNSLDRTYMYGSKVNILGSENLVFENHLLSSGEVIVSWLMQVNYQAARIEPQLPLLQPGKKYQLHLIATTWPVDGVYIRVVFKDINGHIITSEVIRGGQGEFVYPQDAHEYQIELLAAGCYKIHFKRLEIEEYGLSIGHEDYVFSDILNDTHDDNELNVIFTEPLKHAQAELTYAGLLERVPNCLVINSTIADARFYLTTEIKERLHKLLSNYKHLNLIGYGPVTNLTTWYYGAYFKENVKVYETNDFYSLRRYQQLFRQSLHEMLPVDIDLLASRLEKVTKAGFDSDLVLVKPLFDLENRLLQFPMFRGEV